MPGGSIYRGSVDVERLAVVGVRIGVSAGNAESFLRDEVRFTRGLGVVDQLFCDPGPTIGDDEFSAFGDQARGNEFADLSREVPLCVTNRVVAVRDRPVNENRRNTDELVFVFGEREPIPEGAGSGLDRTLAVGSAEQFESVINAVDAL